MQELVEVEKLPTGWDPEPATICQVKTGSEQETAALLEQDPTGTVESPSEGDSSVAVPFLHGQGFEVAKDFPKKSPEERMVRIRIGQTTATAE